jgi:DNA polymerase
MASMLYDKRPDEVSPEERFIGKTTVLGAGYGMGAVKFQAQLQSMGKNVDLDTCKYIIKVYRQRNQAISQWWIRLNDVLVRMAGQQPMDSLDAVGLLELSVLGMGIRLPNNMYLSYPELRREALGEYSYKTRYGRNRIYGGKVAENICQAVARCIIGDQMLEIAKRYRVVLTVHDAIACVVREEEKDEAVAYVESCMRKTPAWAEGLPLNCESGVGETYGDC